MRFRQKYVLKEGDIFLIDCGAEKSGFHGDSCYKRFV
jgi:methionine aminopeptidase